MAARWNKGWFDVAPRYSAGSPAMVDMATALSVARDEVKMFAGALEGNWGPEEQATAQLLGLRGIVEWKMEAGFPGQLLAYDLLTRTWHLYQAMDVTGQWERGNHLRYTRPHGYNVAPPRVEVTALPASRGRKFCVTALDIPDSLPVMYGVPVSEVRDFLSWGVYRKDAPERAQYTHRDVQQAIDEALEDAGVKA